MKNLNKLLPILILISVGLFASVTRAQETGLLNLITTQQGMHRITYEQLLNDHGVDLFDARHGRFALTHAGQKVPIRTIGRDNRKARFGPGGYIEFYADSVDSLYTESRTFTLHSDRSKREDFVKQRLDRFISNDGFASEYQQSRLIEEDTLYDFLSPSESDPWHFGQVYSNSPGDLDTTEVVIDLDEVADGFADMEVEVYGISTVTTEFPDHHYYARVNGEIVGDQEFDGAVSDTLVMSDVPIVEGANNFTLGIRRITTIPFDLMGLNEIRIRYLRNTVATGDYLEGDFDAVNQIMVTGFSDRNTSVYRREANGDITRFTRLSKSDTAVAFKNAGVGGRYIVAGEDGYRQVAAVEPVLSSENITQGSAEYLIISHSEFIGEELDALVQIRSAEYDVKVVDVAQVYAQFGSGQPSGDAIQAYIKYAVTNLDTRFVTLVGGDTYDYKNIGQSNSISYIPSIYVPVPAGVFVVNQTPSDAAYGDIDEDGVPDIPVGRMPVRGVPDGDGGVDNELELSRIVEKIRDFQRREDYAGSVLVAADKLDEGHGISFTQDALAMIAAMPEEFSDTVTEPFRAFPDVDGGPGASAKIFERVNEGVLVTAYIGHSDEEKWSRVTPPLLTVGAIADFNNIDKPTLVSQWGCFNTYSVNPSEVSMGERFLVGGLNGAVTVLGASTLTSSAGERALSIELNKLMYNRNITIGEAIILAKKALAGTSSNSADILLGWQILGDPAIKVNP